MDKSTLENYICQGLSSYAIAKRIGKSQTTVKYWLKKYSLETGFKPFRLCKKEDYKKMEEQRGCIPKTYDWTAIQLAHNNGSTWKDLSKKFNITNYSLAKGKKDGLFVSVSLKEAMKRSPNGCKGHSRESKVKISNARKKYLETHPHPWANKSHNYSAPCELLKSLFRDEGIDFIEEFQPLKEKGRFFAIDIYFPKLKLGIEINGTNHYDKENNLAPYYLNRHNLICEEGILLLEIRYHKIYSEEFRRKLVYFLRRALENGQTDDFSELSAHELSFIN